MEEGDLRECERIVRSRKTAVNIAKRAQMLILAARGLSNRQIALELSANEHVVGRVRKEYRQRGLAVLEDRARPGRPRSSRDEQSVQKVIETVCQAQIRQHGLRVIVQDHADKLIQAVVGSDVDLWGASEKVTQASSAFIVNVRIDQFDRNTLSEEKVSQRT
jgi:transposase